MSIDFELRRRTKSGPVPMQKSKVHLQQVSSACCIVSATARTTHGCGGVHSRKRFGNLNSHATPPVSDAVAVWFKLKTNKNPSNK